MRGETEYSILILSLRVSWIRIAFGSSCPFSHRHLVTGFVITLLSSAVDGSEDVSEIISAPIRSADPSWDGMGVENVPIDGTVWTDSLAV